MKCKLIVMDTCGILFYLGSFCLVLDEYFLMYF